MGFEVSPQRFSQQFVYVRGPALLYEGPRLRQQFRRQLRLDRGAHAGKDSISGNVSRRVTGQKPDREGGLGFRALKALNAIAQGKRAARHPG